MKITSLTISPRHTWDAPSAKNPLRAVVKLSDERPPPLKKRYPDEMMQPLLDMVSGIVAEACQEKCG